MNGNSKKKSSDPGPGAGPGAPASPRPFQAPPPRQFLYHAPSYGIPPRPDEPSTAGEISIGRLMRVARRKWRMLVVAPGIAVLLSACYILTATKVYRAECLVEMSLRRPRIMGQRGAVIEDTDSRYESSENVIITRLEKLKRSPAAMDRAVSNVLQAAKALPTPAKDLRQLMQGNLSLRMVRSTRLLRVSFQHSDRRFAVAAVNAYADAIESLVAEESKSASDSAVAWLAAQAVLQREALERDDEALMRFDKENQIDSMEREKKQIEDSLKGFNDVLTQIESQHALASELCKNLAALEIKPGEAGRLPEAMPRSKEIEPLVEQLVLAVSKRDELQTKYTPKHPEVAAQEEVIKALVRRAKETAESNLSLLRQQSESFRRDIQKQSKQAAELGQKIVEGKTRRTSLERAREASDLSYKGVLNRIQEARLSADENTATVKIVGLPGLPENPVWPNKVAILAAALLIGAIGGIGLALYADALEDHVTGAADVELDLGLKILGLVPHVPSATDENTCNASMGDTSSPLSEAFAGMRGLLDSPQYESVSHSVLVTSTAPGEGKTVAACNLAMASAKTGRRTLLVDLDMRRPRIAAALNLKGMGAELGDFLTSRDVKRFERMPEKSVCHGLDVIASRDPLKSSQADLLGGRSLRVFIEWAAGAYDRVIIDSPPFGLVSDSAVLSTLTGCVVLLCRPNSTRKRALEHAARHFRDVGANVIGVIVNDVELDRGFHLTDFGHYGVYSYGSYSEDAGKRKWRLGGWLVRKT